MLPLEGQRRPILPGGKDGAQGANVLAHARNRGRPLRRVAAHDIAAHLGAHAEFETSAGKGLKIPGRLGDVHGAARKNHENAGRDPQALGRRQGRLGHEQPIVDGVGHIQAVIAQGLGTLGVRGHFGQGHSLVHRRPDLHPLSPWLPGGGNSTAGRPALPGVGPCPADGLSACSITPKTTGDPQERRRTPCRDPLSGRKTD